MKPSALTINLDGIPEERWKEAEDRCADCRVYFDDIPKQDEGEDDEDSSGGSVPLLLWRKKNKEMLRLCWKCATKRMSPGEEMSGSE